MSSIRTLGIACLNRGDLLLRCVLSVDQPIDTLFIINNGEDKSVAEAVEEIQSRSIANAGIFGNIRVEKYRNIGCGPAWNRIIKSSPGCWLLLGNDVQMLPGSLKKLSDAVEMNPEAALVYHRGLGYSGFVLTEVGFSKVGFFDENFYPAYFEDCDHYRRLTLAQGKVVDVQGFECIHGGGGTIKSDPVLLERNALAYENLRAYYLRKWGGHPGGEAFERPFNKDVPTDFWEIDKELRRMNSGFYGDVRSFEEISRAVGTDKSSHGYHVFYEKHFGPLRDRPISILEIGVQKGFSLRLWEEFFPSARIYAIDIDPGCASLGSKRSKVFIGDQGDTGFLASVAQETGPLDIVIDDGGHMMDPQQISFVNLIPHVRPGGLYVIEDLQTSYYPHCDGGVVGKKGTTISMAKALVDDVNAQYHGGKRIAPAPISEMHFYKNIVFFVRS